MTSLGDYLRKEREAKNLSVQEVAERTKISKRYLLFIESDDYDQLPQGPYVKGYISAYAHQVCEDANQALKLYETAHPHAPLPTDLERGPVSEKNGRQTGRIEEPPSNGESKPMWRTGVSAGLSMVHGLGKVLPTLGERSGMAAVGASALSAFTARLKVLIATMGKAAGRLRTHLSTTEEVAAGMKAILAAAQKAGAWTIGNRRRLLAISLHTGIAAFCIAVVVFAGLGIYHLFFFDRNPPAIVVHRLAEPAQEQPLATGQSAFKASAEQESGRGATAPPKPSVTDSTPVAAIGKPAATPVPATRKATGVDDAVRPSLEPAASQATPRTAATAAVEVIKASICTGIEDRMPVNVGVGFAWKTPKVYVWSLLGAADPPAKVHHIYYHDNKMISDVVLKVGSANWRTWSLQTLGEERFRGPWRVDITSADGQVLRRLHFEVN